MNVIYPKPKKVEVKQGQFFLLSEKIVFFETPMENVFNELKTLMDVRLGDLEHSTIVLKHKLGLNEQAYEIDITEKCIYLFASSEVGFFYAVKTLKQIARPVMECGFIYDEPDLKVRGFMYDISRNKVPKVETVKYILDLMSDVKMNHFELYVEGFSFEYQSFPQFLEDESYITVEEFKEIEAYANSKYIDLVPNQNGFGHMAEWLKQDAYKDLAEAPDGIFLWGTHRAPSTLDPNDPRSLELIKQMYQDMIPHSNSKYFNMNFDEPFELGRGKSKERCQNEGLGNVYMEYTKKAYDEIKKYQKTPLIWGDVLIHHDDVLDQIPSDMIFIDWGYDASYPFSKNLLTLKKANISFMAAPGTSSWCSFLGRTHDAIETVNQACIYTKMYGGEGILMTDWGDFGHLQYLPISIAPLIYSGLMSYRVDGNNYKLLKPYLNRFVFHDDANIMADLMLDLGNYYRYENGFVGNATHAFHGLMWAVHALKEKDPQAYYTQKMQDKFLSLEKYDIICDFFALKRKELMYAQVDDLIKEEIKHAIYFVETLYKLNISFNPQLDMSEKRAYMQAVIDSQKTLIEGLRHLWLMRNKKSRLDHSCEYINKLIQFTKIILGGTYEVKN